MLHSETLPSQVVRPTPSDELPQLSLPLTEPCPTGYEQALTDFDHVLSAANLLARLHLPPVATELLTTFPKVERPRFVEGDRLRWIGQGELADWGVAIGRFYSFAPHHRCWTWCYLIWLDADSPSAAWVTADIAWEEDLEPLEVEAMS